MIWLLFAGMTLAALAALLLPLLRERPHIADAQHMRVAIYKSQIAEVERDVAGGRIGSGDAQAARTEAGRRLVAESGARQATAPSMPRRMAAATLVVACCLAGVLLYARIGSPALPDVPLAARTSPSETPDFAGALARIEAHLVREPDDLRGWNVIAPVYLRMGRIDDAVRAFGSIVRLDADNAAPRADLAEAQIYAAKGVVTEDARRGLEAALERDPTLAKARYYVGLAAEQGGDRARATEIWRSLAADSPPGSPLATALTQRIGELDGASATADVAASIAALPSDAQTTAIRGMVERLAGRLHENGDDIEGWLRLVRAYRVLNEQDKARAALSDARKTFASDGAATTRLDALSRELGLEG